MVIETDALTIIRGYVKGRLSFIVDLKSPSDIVLRELTGEHEMKGDIGGERFLIRDGVNGRLRLPIPDSCRVNRRVEQCR